MTDSSYKNRPYTPTREEFHRYYGGEIYLSDFSTEKCCSPHVLDRMIYDLRREGYLFAKQQLRKFWR